MKSETARMTSKLNIQDALLATKMEKFRNKMMIKEELNNIKRIKEQQNKDMHDFF